MSEATEKARADRLARAYLIMVNYSFGSKRKKLFPLVMEVHKAVTLDDIAPVRDAVFAEIEPFPDDEDEALFDVRSCRVCGCTDDEACEGGCWWVEWDLCSSCADQETTES